MADERIVAVMEIKKTTQGTVVFEETEDGGSPHLEAVGRPLNIYIPKPAYKLLLGEPTIVTVLIEPGDQTAQS